MTDKERIEISLKCMAGRRVELLDEYLLSLERPGWTQEESMQAVIAASRLHDCDKHLENLKLELNRRGLTKSETEKIVADVIAEKSEKKEAANA